jgi:hypothetical protein
LTTGEGVFLKMGHPNTRLYLMGAKSDHHMTRLNNLTKSHYPGFNLSERNEPNRDLN